MNLIELYPQLNIYSDVYGITNNSKSCKKNFIFVAIKGKQTNGQKYIKEAISNGAILIVTDQLVLGNYNHIRVKDAKLEYINLLQKFYNYKPSIYTVGITGTDGKTTTALILYHIFNTFLKASYIGTNGITYLNKNIAIPHTTPTPSLLYPTYCALNKLKFQDLIMEISSEGILDKRIENFAFNGAIYTNLSWEHLNSHKNMNNYFMCKANLFKKIIQNGLIVINTDDYYAHFIKNFTNAKLISYGINSGIYQAKNIKLHFNYSTFDVYYLGRYLSHFKIPLFGKYNIYNALGCIAYAYELGIDIDYIKKGLETIKNISGRFMTYQKNNITAIVDFAHTPNALKNLYENIQIFKKNKIIHVIGAAGNKDQSKRAIMAEIVTSNADITIFTSEDPKDENIFKILYDLTKNLKDKEYYLTISRKEAIKLAARIARQNDIILITGKGNENYETIADIKFHHNDYEEIKKALG